MIRTIGTLVLIAAVGAASPAAARQNETPLPRVAVDVPLAEAAGGQVSAAAAAPVPILVRNSADPVGDEDALGRALSALPGDAQAWLALARPPAEANVPAFRAALQRLLAAHPRRVAVLELDVDTASPSLADYVVRVTATDTRAVADGIRIALAPGGVPGLRALYSAALAPYVDLVVLPSGSELDAAGAFVSTIDPGTPMAVAGLSLEGTGIPAVRAFLAAELETLGTHVVLQAWQPSAGLQDALVSLGPLAPLLASSIAPLDTAATLFELHRAGSGESAPVRYRLLFDSRTFATYLAYWGDRAPGPLDVRLRLPVEGTPAVYRLDNGARLEASDYRRDADTGLASARLPAADGPMLVNFSEGAAEVFGEINDVAAERQLSVEEIIARHQRQQRAQDAVLTSYIALARTDQHFRPTMTDPGYDVSSENRYFVSGDDIEWEELSFSVNGTKWGPDRPAFPLLQPEKVLSLPLQLRFGSDYHYRLQGTDRVAGYDCYVVRFEPAANDGRSLYKGTLWIDRRTFARIKVQAVQTGLTGPVVSNEEIQTYAPAGEVDGRPVFLFTGLTARQIVLIAGRNLLVEKSVAFTDFRLNPREFAAARQEARRSDRIMYRETDRGLRYYVKEGDQRVVSERATRTARAVAMGLTLDPSYGFPLPIFGINYLNFEFRNPDTQLAVLFAGVLAAGNIQRPRLGSTPFDASVDFFAIAAPSSDRLYDASGEREAERLLTWPLTTGANLGWQYTPFQKVTGQYQFRFDGYVHDRTTAGDYVTPASTITNGFGGAWEYRRGGYSLLLNGTRFVRAGWHEWGPAATAASSSDVHAAYTKYSASLSRDIYFKVFHKIHVNAAWFGGRDLDRFAKYQFGMFDDTRVHGVPASGVRFGELGMLRGSYSFNLFDQYRLDLFLERAWGRDRAFDDEWQPITGIGAAFNLRTPWHTMLRADVGKSFLPERYRGVGSATLQLMLLKPLR
jgi:hypothetical protein